MKDTILENRNKGFRAGAIVVKDNKLLLMHQYLGPRPNEGKEAEDFYTLPGGSWEMGETLEQTCKREIKEEFSIDVTVGKLVFLIDTSTRIAFYFVCETNDTNIKLGGPEGGRMSEDEQYHVAWVDIAQIEHLNFIPKSAKEALIKYLDNPHQSAFFLSENK